jgi:hypothetical protein
LKSNNFALLCFWFCVQWDSYSSNRVSFEFILYSNYVKNITVSEDFSLKFPFESNSLNFETKIDVSKYVLNEIVLKVIPKKSTRISRLWRVISIEWFIAAEEFSDYVSRNLNFWNLQIFILTVIYLTRGLSRSMNGLNIKFDQIWIREHLIWTGGRSCYQSYNCAYKEKNFHSKALEG